MVHRGICYRAFDLSGFCNRANGHRAFGYRPYVVYPEKAFDRVPRDVLWWALRQSEVDERIVRVIQSMHEGASTSVKLGVGESVEFAVKVGVHQGSALSPLLFIIVLEALSKNSGLDCHGNCFILTIWHCWQNPKRSYLK